VTAAVVEVESAATRYALDKSSSRFTVKAFATGMLSSFGHSPTFAIRDFSGEASYDPAVPAAASLVLKVRADSLEVMDDIKSKDRREIESTMNESVLESAKYPEIVFISASISSNKLSEGRFQVNVSGNLSLHGVTRPLAVPAQLAVMGDEFRASGEVSLSQSNFGIQPVSVAGGALKLKDELKFSFDIRGAKVG
jgi:polyisoprenoid-binding protein YceI